VTVIEDEADFPSLVAVIVAVPGATAVTTPEGETVAIPASSVVQSSALEVSDEPWASNVEAFSVAVVPTVRDSVAGVTLTVATGAGGIGEIVSSALPVFPSLVATM
jgi:hypothetical protein